MSRILHILKDRNPPEALTVIAKQAERPAQEVSLLLIQDAVRLQPHLPVKVYLLEDDARTRGVTSRFEAITYSKMLDLIFSSDSVVTW